MERALSFVGQTAEQDRQITEALLRQGARLRSYIRKQVDNAADAEDILQDVFAEFVESYRLLDEVQNTGAWLYRVARNRVIDFFRKRRPQPLNAVLASNAESEDGVTLEDLLPSPEDGPEAAYVRTVLMDEIEAALDELPPEQRDAFVAHEIDGQDFKEIAQQTGVSINTLLSRKRYAVLHLRQRLRAIHDEFKQR